MAWAHAHVSLHKGIRMHHVVLLGATEQCQSHVLGHIRPYLSRFNIPILFNASLSIPCVRFISAVVMCDTDVAAGLV